MLIFIIVTTILLFIYVLRKGKLGDDTILVPLRLEEYVYKRSYIETLKLNFGVGYIICMLIHLILTFGFYVTSVFTIYFYSTNQIQLDESTGGIGFVFLMYLAGLVCLKNLLCIIFLREDATWFSD